MQNKSGVISVHPRTLIQFRSMTSSKNFLFGALLREHRTRRNMTLRQLAESAVCAEVTLRKIEKGARRPSQAMASAIADALALDASERTVFIAEAKAAPPARNERKADLESLWTLAEQSFLRYPDVLQSVELDQLDARFAEIDATIVSMLRADVRAAQHLAGTLCEFWQKRNHISSGGKLLEQALLLDLSATEARARALLAAGTICACQNEFTRGERHIIECLRISEQLKLAQIIARATHVHAWMMLWSGQRHSAAVETYEAAIRMYAQSGDPLRCAHAHCDLGLAWVYGTARNCARAEECIATGLDHFRAAACASGIAFAHHAMAQLHIENLQYDAAEHHEAQALATFRRASSRRDIAWSLAHMGEIALARGNTSEAKAYWEEALAYFLETGEHNAICTALNSLARIAREIGDPLSARKKIIAGLHLAQDRHRPYVLAHGLYELAGLQLEFGSAFTASMLLGAADTLVSRLHMQKLFTTTPHFEEWRSMARSHLGAELFDTAIWRGAEMSVAEAIALASAW